MQIAILGSREPHPHAEAVATTLGRVLSLPLCDEGAMSKKNLPRHRLIVTGAATGVAEAVRRGAFESPTRHVTTHFIVRMDPAAEARWTIDNQYYAKWHNDYVSRVAAMSAAQVIVFMHVTASNVAIAMQVLYERRIEASHLLHPPLPKRELYLWKPGLPPPHSTLTLEVLRSLLGSHVNEEDKTNLHLFESADEVISNLNAPNEL